MSAAVMADTQYPIPITNNIERTSDTSLKVLAYPKYYKAADGKLAKVETSLVPSPDPAWDFEVTKGIWTLKIRKDGLFQAIHDSDIFAYRFQSLGLGRGSHYAAFNFGDIDWSNYSVSGNAITWHDVYPQIDVTVRYFHDILKVDVLIEKKLVKKIEAFVGEKKMEPKHVFDRAVRYCAVVLDQRAHAWR
ncbi:hypothetical protein GF373_10635 [bacterium]|nr:hypothetical protein [bacterium]